MRDHRIPKSVMLGVCCWLSQALVHAQTPQAGPDLVRTLNDGLYEANAGYGVYSDSLTFKKSGASLIGYRANPYGIWCFKGTLAGDVLEFADVVNWHDDWANGKKTGTFRFEPLREAQDDMLDAVRVAKPIYPFPKTGGLIPRSPAIIKRDQAWLDGCLKYYGGDGVPPCGDPDLRGTELNDGAEEKYRKVTTVCTVSSSSQYVMSVRVEEDSCTVSNVYGVLLSTPGAIAPTGDDSQAVENCGILVLRSVTSPNKIRVELDKARHRVINYTMPGHQLYPGMVVRQIEEVNGAVNVVTIGTGTITGAKKIWNELLATPLWFSVDEELKTAFAKKFAMEIAEMSRPPE